jgi:iron complex outermembrane receptor protein
MFTRHGRRYAVFTVLCMGTVSFFAGAAAAADSGSPTQAAVQTASAGAGAALAPQEPEMVTITGSRLVTTLGQTAQDVHIYELPQIEQSGQSTVTDFLATLPEVSLSSVESTNLGTTVRIRGAIRGSALILINGRRVQAVTGGVAAFGFFDLNTIPLSLVERIEVLPTGSSAIYGGDALAGVVNIVLRSDFNGFELDGGYRFADDTDEKILSLAAGWKANDFSASIMGTFSDRSPLLGTDRAITANPDLRSLGGPNLGTQFLGVPANVNSVSGNLPGLNSSFAAVPVGSTGIGLTPSSFAATEGTVTTGSFTRYQAAIPETHKGGIFATASYRFAPSLEVFTEFLISAYKFEIAFTPPFLQLASVPPTNPFSPWNQNSATPATVRVSGVVQGAESLPILRFNEDFLRPLVGARGSFGDWQYEITGLTSRDKGSSVTSGQPNSTALTAALKSSDPATALNPFIDGPMASPALLASIYSVTTITSYKADSNIVNGFVRGPLIDLPGGPLDVVVGGEYEDSSLKRNFESNRTAKAAFGELRAPIAMATNDNGGTRELLTLQAAGRYDDYSDFGSQPTWQAGLEFRPTDTILLRSTHATAFKPPTLYNLGAPRTSVQTPIMDPLQNNKPEVVTATTGGNPHLDPTTGTSTTAGIVWSPMSVPGLNVSITPWWLRIENAISLPNINFVISNENLYPGRVVRAPAPPGQAVGDIISVDYSYINFGLMRESGIDAAVDWSFRTGWGEFTPAIAVTYMNKYEGASTPGAPIINRLSRANNDLNWAPRWKGTASIGWAPDTLPIKLAFAGRFIGSYVDYVPPRTLGDVWYFDATLELDLVRALGMYAPPLGGVKLLVSVTNLTDTLPPYSNYFRGYDPEIYDLAGRTIFLRLQIQS